LKINPVGRNGGKRQDAEISQSDHQPAIYHLVMDVPDITNAHDIPARRRLKDVNSGIGNDRKREAIPRCQIVKFIRPHSLRKVNLFIANRLAIIEKRKGAIRLRDRVTGLAPPTTTGSNQPYNSHEKQVRKDTGRVFHPSKIEKKFR
jgi:hypothetical protein